MQHVHFSLKGPESTSLHQTRSNRILEHVMRLPLIMLTSPNLNIVAPRLPFNRLGESLIA